VSKKNLAYINPEMLKWARSETPFKCISDVVIRISKLAYEDVESWENGDSLPSITEAKVLAKLYDVPFACLYFSEVPKKKPRPYTDRRTRTGTFFEDMSYELWCETRRIMSNRETALDVAPDLSSVYDVLPTIDITESTASVATKIREYLDVKTPFQYKTHYGNAAFNYFRDKFESKGIMVTQLSGISTDEIRGLSIYFDTLPIIAVNNRDWERAKVFTLFHEMAHLLRRSSSLCLINFDEHDDDEEKICDRIAAEALLPEESFRTVSAKIQGDDDGWDDLCLMKIADRYAVSTVVVLRRLYDLKIIDRAYYQKRYSALSAGFEANRYKQKGTVPVDYHYRFLNKQGYLFPRILLSAYSNGNISYGEMCKSLNVNTSHISSIEQVVMFK